MFGVRPVRRAVGCAECGRTGYRGRIPIVELFQTTAALQSLMRVPAASSELHEAAVASGMRPLRDAALDLVRRGDTTLAEVHRVIGDATSRSDAADPEAETGPAGDAVEASHETDTPAPLAAAVRPAVPAGGGLAAGSVLVVDDEPTNRVFVRALLEKTGFRVSEAPDGLAALERLATETFDLLILDLDMPGLAGYEVLSHVRRQISTATLPVIVLTGTTNPNAEIEVMERGADDYLTKPIDASRFIARIKATLRRAHG